MENTFENNKELTITIVKLLDDLEEERIFDILRLVTNILIPFKSPFERDKSYFIMRGTKLNRSVTLEEIKKVFLKKDSDLVFVKNKVDLTPGIEKFIEISKDKSITEIVNDLKK